MRMAEEWGRGAGSAAAPGSGIRIHNEDLAAIVLAARGANAVGLTRGAALGANRRADVGDLAIPRGFALAEAGLGYFAFRCCHI